MKTLLYIILFIAILWTPSLLSQEKRIALVIGNSDYQYQQKLKNPVRDAILMAQTLESLDFDVILDTNITTKRKFVKAISEFGAKRESYDVGFIFYAGHGMQVNGKNYLLPTEEDFEDKADLVEQFAVGAEMVMEYLTKQTDQVNVLILDACRNNPLPDTRSVGVGGLAEMQAKGSLIAFSTTAGNVAKDGDGNHSIYCMSLVKNMLIEGIDLGQVFRNVRKEVNELTGQSTVNYDQLTGNSFYLKRATFTDDIILIDSLIEAGDYKKGLKIANNILNEDPTNLEGLLREVQLYGKEDRKDLALIALNKAKELYPNSKKVYLWFAALLTLDEKYDEAHKEIDYALQLDPNYTNAYIEQANIYYNQNKSIEAVNSTSKAIELDSLNDELYFSRAFIFTEMDSIILAEKDYEKVIELNPEYLEAYYNLGVIQYENGLNEDALMDFEKVLEIDSTFVNAINYIGVIYKDLGIIDLAIQTYERGITLEQTDPLAAAFCYQNRASIYIELGKSDEALADYDKSIELDPDNPLRYQLRANFYEELGEENKALIDYSKAIDLDKENPERWADRAEFHYYAGHDQDAIQDYKKVLELDSTNIDAINTIGLIYQEQGKIDLAIETYERGIALEKTDPIAASYCYRNRGIIYIDQEKYQKAIDDFTKTIELDPNTPSRYIDRANCYRDMNENEKALEDYDMAIQVDPKDAENWYWRGSFLFDFMSDYKGAIRDLEKSISLNPSDIDNYIWLGELYYEIEDYAKSIEISLKGIEVDKNDISGLELLYETISDSYYDMGNIDKALEYIDKHLSLSPRPLITEWKGEIYEHDLNEPYTALNLYTAGINIDSSCYYCWDSRARLYGKKLHNYEMAIKDFKYITTYIDTNDVIELNWIGVYYHRLGEEEKAKEYYNKVIQKYNAGIEFNQNEINGGVAWSFNNLGVYNERDNDYVAAQKFYNKAIEINAQYPDRYYWRGWFYFNCLKKYDLALLDIQQAIDLDPENSKWVLCKANMLEKANRLSQAEDIYDLAKKLFPKDQNVQLERARFLGISGKLKSSEKEFKKLQHHKTLDAEYLNYQIEMYIKNKDFNEAKKLARECLNLYPKDTISRMYLADIYFEEQNFSASCMNYTYLISMMENNDNYLEYEPHLNQINLSELYIKQANTFEKVQDQQSQCEALKKALSNLKNMYGIYNKKELQKELENKIQSLCTP